MKGENVDKFYRLVGNTVVGRIIVTHPDRLTITNVGFL